MKTVLITGASSGFGLKMVHDFLNDGWKVIATIRNVEQRKSDIENKLTCDIKNLEFFELDMTKRDQIEALKNHIENNYHAKLDVLINNAGFGTYGALEDISEEQLRYQMEVNFFGPSILTKCLLPFIRNTKGKIINISSLMGRYSCPLASVYSASKYALEGLTEGLMYELDSFGVQVCTIQPGGHRTNFVKSVIWGDDSFGANSVYQSKTNAFKAMMDKLSSRKKAPGSDTVSLTALKIAKADSAPRSVLVGKDANFVGWLQSLLPAGLYRAIMFMANRKIFGS